MMAARKLNILVFGAGAIGSYIGGSLGLSGNEVSFIDRPQNLSGLKANGVYVTRDGQTNHLTTPRVYASVREALEDGRYDVALFALKSFDTQAVLDSMQGLEAKLPPLLCLQNGVDNEPTIAKHIGADKVISATVTTAIGKPGLGQVVVERKRGIGIGAGHPLSETLVDALNNADLNAKLYPDALAMKWTKLLTNLLANAQCAILDRTPQQILSDFSTYKVEMEQLREALRVMRALGLKPVDLPGTPSRLLAFGAGVLPMRLSQPAILRVAGKGRGAKMPSLHIDRFSGRKQSEVEWLNGAVARWGAETGVATPVNQDLNNQLLRLI